MDDTFERQVQPLANQLRVLFPSLTNEQATDTILRHGLNLQASIDELLANPLIPALPPKNSNPFTTSNIPVPAPSPSHPTNLLDLDDLFGFSSPKVTPSTAQNYSTTTNDLSDIFGGITTSPPPESTPKKEHKKRHGTKAESEAEKDTKKKEKKKSKEDKDKSDVKKDTEKKSKKDTSYSDTEAVEIKNKDKKKEKKDKDEKEKVKEDKEKQKSKDEKDKQKDKEKKEKQKSKEEKEKKDKDEKEKKEKDEKEKKEKDDKKKHEKEKEKQKQSDKRKSVDVANPNSNLDTIKHEPSSILSGYDKSGESEEELSKPEEGVMQWITKLKKAHTSRLITITNQSKFILERKKLHQSKGKWRRKPPDSIYLNNSAQFGVEGKNGTEGACSFSISEDYTDNLEFVWTYNNEKDKIPTTYCVIPASLSDHVVISVLPKLSEKFCDIQFVIRNKSDEKSTESHNLSVSGQDTSISENESENVSVGAAKSMLQSLQRSGSSGSVTSAPTYKVTEYHQGQSQNDDSSSDSEDEASKEENRRKSLIRNMKLKQSDESVEHADSKTLAAAVSSLKLAAPISGNLSDGGSARASRRRVRPGTVVLSSPDVSASSPFAPPNVNLFAKENESSISIPNPNLTESEREDDDSSVKTRSPQAHNEEEEDVEVDINEKSKNLMKSAFSKLESGHFVDSLNDVNETLRLFVSLSDPRAKQRESKICSSYKFGLNILINRPRESDPQRVALLLKTLADLTWQPKHRIVCVRMAIKANIESKNYGVAARFIQQLLPLELADKKNQEANLQICKENNLTDQIQSVFPFTCPHCSKPANVGNLRCNSCNTPILMCFNSFEIIHDPQYFQCEYCDAVFAKKSGKCGFCNFGALKEKTLTGPM